MKKKTLVLIWVISIIISILAGSLGILTFFGYHPFSQVAISQPEIQRLDLSLINQDSTSATYSMNAIFRYIEPRANACNPNTADIKGTIDFDIYNIPSSGSPEFVDGLTENEYFSTNDIVTDLKAITGNFPCKDISINLNNSDASCQIKNAGEISGVKRARLECRFNLNYVGLENGVPVNANYWGMSHIETKITIPKIGYCQPGLTKCSDGICKINCNSCSSGQTRCQDGVCRENCVICDENDLRCSGENLEICNSNKWVLKEQCRGGCEGNKCKGSNIGILIISLLIILGFLVLLAFFTIKKIKKKR